MFERYSERARRVIFWARGEASTFGSPEIDVLHLLLGLIREAPALLKTFVPSDSSLDLFRDDVAAAVPQSHLEIATCVDLPLSHQARNVLQLATEESDRLGDPSIRIIHLLLGLGREPATEGLLKSRGIDYEHVLKEAESFREAPAR